MEMDVDLDLEFLARDLDLSYLQYLLAQNSSGGEDKYIGLENPFSTVTQVEIEETAL